MEKVYIENPIYLDVIENGIKLISPSEIFVAYPQNKEYYISNMGRCWSNKRNILLKPQFVGSHNRSGQMRRAYKLYDGSNKSYNVKIAKMVSDVFCENKYNDSEKVVTHHKDFNELNDIASNLQIMTYAEHCLIHQGKRVFSVYDNELIEHSSIKELCGVLNVDYMKIYKAMNEGNVVCTHDNVSIVELRGVTDADGKPIYIGYRLCPNVKKEDSSCDGLLIAGAIVVGALLLGALIYKVMK